VLFHLLLKSDNKGILLLRKIEETYNLMKFKEKKNQKNPKKAITNG
jgi:hypothetical protein